MNDDAASPLELPPLTLQQRGRAGALAPIVLLNTFLNIITLSIYRFWGKTKVRQYLWRQTYFMDEPLEYSGSGGELFKGFLAAAFLVLLPMAVVSNLAETYLEIESTAFAAFSVLFYIVVYSLIGMAIYRARRYRLSRTAWRGIRGGMRGSSGQYAVRYLLLWALTLITLGWAYPWMRQTLFARLMGETTFGNRPFLVVAKLWPLYRIFSACWLGSFLMFAAGMIWLTVYSHNDNEFKVVWTADISFWLIAVLWFLPIPVALLWYRAHEINHFAKATTIMGVSFEMKAGFWNLSGLVSLNFLIIICSLGFGIPFAQLRTFRYFCDHLTIQGNLTPEWIEQTRMEAPTIGEGLADAFDLGAV